MTSYLNNTVSLKNFSSSLHPDLRLWRSPSITAFRVPALISSSQTFSLKKKTSQACRHEGQLLSFKHVETSNITFVQFWSNEWHGSFHLEKHSMLHPESLQSVFDGLSHFHLLNRRHLQSRRQWLRAKVNKIPTSDVLKNSIA